MLSWNTPSTDDHRTFSPSDVFEAGRRHHHLANTAYPIHHQTTMAPYRVPRQQSAQRAVADWQNADRLGLYVHIPFCKVRCKHCEYATVEHNDAETQEAYFEALIREFRLWRGRLDTSQATAIGLDIGGGTPALVDHTYIERVLDTARATFRFGPGMTVSIETTPFIAASDPARLRALRDMGIERISMGVQTTHLPLARAIGRDHAGGVPLLGRAVANIRQAGFRRLNIDLMYGFADQPPHAWQHTVEQTICLDPEYITLYQMRYKGTHMHHQAARVTRGHVNYLRETARHLLHTSGYAATCGKNTYSRVPGDVGTSDYLTERVVKGTPYLGLGLAVQSMSRHTLSYNLGAASKTLRAYVQAVRSDRLPLQDLYHLSLPVAMAKMISVSFYFGQIHLEHFCARFGVRLQDQFRDEVDFVPNAGLMHHVGPYLCLTPRGAQCLNGVIALFYSGAVKSYLVHLDPEPRPAQDEGRCHNWSEHVVPQPAV